MSKNVLSKVVNIEQPGWSLQDIARHCQGRVIMDSQRVDVNARVTMDSQRQIGDTLDVPRAKEKVGPVKTLPDYG